MKTKELDLAVIAKIITDCKGSAVDKLFLLVTVMFRTLGLNTADFPDTVNSSLFHSLVDARKLWAAPDNAPDKKAWRPLAAEAYRGFTYFMLMTAADADDFNNHSLDARVWVFKQVVIHIHNSLQIGADGFLLDVLRYAVDTDPIISSKARTFFFVLSRPDFDNYYKK